MVVDLDNTIVPRNQEKIDEKYRQWLNELKAQEFRVFIVSNNFSERVSRALEGVPVDGLIAPAGKPFLKRIRSMFDDFNIDPAGAVFIGDQVFTDLVAARRLGCHAYLVIPISDYDLPHTRLLRLVEKVLINRWKKNDGL